MSTPSYMGILMRILENDTGCSVCWDMAMQVKLKCWYSS